MSNVSTVRELIGFLLEHNLDLPVLATWEGVTRAVGKENIYEGNPAPRHPGSGTFGKYLLIDADENFYKKEYQDGLSGLKSTGSKD